MIAALAWLLILVGVLWAGVNYLRFSGAHGFDQNADIALHVFIGGLAIVLGVLLHIVSFIVSFF